MAANTVTRADLCEAVYRKVALSRPEAAAFVELVLKEITDSLERGESVKLSGFGIFAVRGKAARLGRNPKTMIDVPIPARRVLAFKPAAIFRQRVNARPIGRGNETAEQSGVAPTNS